MRNLGAVLDKIFLVAPDIKPEFDGLLSSLPYTAPEAMVLRWRQAAEILNAFASDHPNKDDIAKIFSGKE